MNFGLSSKTDDEAFICIVRYNPHEETASISHGVRINCPWFIGPLNIGCLCLSVFPTCESLRPRDGQTSDNIASDMLDFIFCGKAEDRGDRREVGWVVF